MPRRRGSNMQEESEGEVMRRGFKRSVKGKERAWEDRRGSMMDEMDDKRGDEAGKEAHGGRNRGTTSVSLHNVFTIARAQPTL